jgi:hypothetical protein
MGMDFVRVNFVLWQCNNPANHDYRMSKVCTCLRSKIKARQEPVNHGAIVVPT